MAWKCRDCGAEVADSTVRVCAACGFVRFGQVVLVSEVTGREVRAGVDTDLGRVLLEKAAGEEARFAAPRQFRLVRDASRGGWTIVHCPEGRNPTFLDGADLGTEPALLEDGAVVSVGPEKARMRVRIEG